MLSLIKRLFNIFSKQESRNEKLRKNIFFSFIIKGLSVAISFIIIRLTLGFIDSTRYGIWVTISSIISWFTFFDFGMANGLKNNLARAIALKNNSEVKKYISTAYALFIIISLFVFLLFLFVNPAINWNNLLNIPVTVKEDFQTVMLIVTGTFCIQFVFQLINAILAAHQESATADLLNFLGQLLVLICILILMKTTTGTLKNLVIALNFSPAFVLIAASFIIFGMKYKAIAPAISDIDLSYAKKILNIGGAFFAIQLGALILFQTDNFIISKIIGPEAVTKFNITYKLYSVIIISFSIIMTPFWSAFTDAWVKKDFLWIRKSMLRLRKLWILTSFLAAPVLFLISKSLFKIWLGQKVAISSMVSFLMMIYAISYTCLALNCYFLNGVGRIRLQLILYLFVIFINPVLCILLGKMFDIEGVIIANILSFIFMDIVLWIQTDKLIHQKATGIWNK